MRAPARLSAAWRRKALIADPGEVRGLRLGQTLDAGQAERGVTGDAAADRRWRPAPG